MLSDLNDRIDSTFRFVEIGLVFSVPRLPFPLEIGLSHRFPSDNVFLFFGMPLREQSE